MPGVVKAFQKQVLGMQLKVAQDFTPCPAHPEVLLYKPHV
jgi:hypothetical protein